jgi:hypothetical protein
VQLAICFSYGRTCSSEIFEWFDVSEHDQRQSPKERLRTILMPLPRLLRSAETSGTLSIDECQQALRSLVAVYRQLRNWKIKFDLQLIGYEEVPCPDIILEFGIDAVDPCLLYWAACIASQKAIEQFNLVLLDETKTYPLHDSSILLDPDATIENISKFASFLLRPEAGLMGFISICLPISILCRYGLEHTHEVREDALLMLEDLINIARTGPTGLVIEQIMRRMFIKLLPT